MSRFDPELPLERARTPPSRWYVTDSFYELEREHVFAVNWCAAARVDQLAEPGDFVCGVLAGEPYVLVRGRDGEIRGFYNVCSHHAAEVLEGTGRCEQIVCPYHAWAYDLEGTLQKAPEMGAIDGVNRETLSLKPIAVTTFGPLVFICLATPPARTMESDFGPLKNVLDETGWERTTFVRRKSWLFECNWKVFVDNYLDGGYHIAHLHKGLARELDLSTYQTDVFDRYSIQTCENDRAAPRVDGKAYYAWLYPNFMINRYGRWLDTNWVFPDGPNRTIVHIDWYVEDPNAPGLSDELEDSGSVQDEDVSICESVQRGLTSRAYDQGYYSTRREAAAYAFHRLLARDLEGNDVST